MSNMVYVVEFLSNECIKCACIIVIFYVCQCVTGSLTLPYSSFFRWKNWTKLIFNRMRNCFPSENFEQSKPQQGHRKRETELKFRGKKGKRTCQFGSKEQHNNYKITFFGKNAFKFEDWISIRTFAIRRDMRKSKRRRRLHFISSIRMKSLKTLLDAQHWCTSQISNLMMTKSHSINVVAKNRMSLHLIFIIFSWLSFSSSLQKRWWWWHLYDKIHDYNYIWHIQEQRSIWEHNVWSKPGDHILNSKIRKWMMTNFFSSSGPSEMRR